MIIQHGLILQTMLNNQYDAMYSNVDHAYMLVFYANTTTYTHVCHVPDIGVTQCNQDSHIVWSVIQYVSLDALSNLGCVCVTNQHPPYAPDCTISM